jgi:aspartate ammonia-lyase
MLVAQSRHSMPAPQSAESGAPFFAAQTGRRASRRHGAAQAGADDTITTNRVLKRLLNKGPLMKPTITNSLESELAALAFHAAAPAGKIGTALTKPLATLADLALAYSPGVAAPVKAIAADETKAFDYTAKGNLVAVISNGTAILGLGNLGPAAAKPVLEGKAALFKRFAAIDAVDLEIQASTPDEFVAVVKALAPTFGAINLEDIAAPSCFEIEERLQAALEIPVLHDDQHGTAVAVAAALLNACAQSGRSLATARIVVNGAGAAGIGCANLLVALGTPLENLILCDIEGVLHIDRKAGVHRWITPFLRDTPMRVLAEAVRDADILVGLSVAGAFSPDHITTMNDRPIVFALANPEPEIFPGDVLAVRPDAIVATGRSDLPNQVNNLLAFPYLFRGALDVRATQITSGMKIAAARALAELAALAAPGEQRLLPCAFDPRLRSYVATAVSNAALRDGVARLSAPRAHRPAASSQVAPAALIASPSPASDRSVRIERDPLGDVVVPHNRYYGPQTARAVDNFNISGRSIGQIPELVAALAWVKKAAALTNRTCGHLPADLAHAICQACDDVFEGRLNSEFVVDVLQGGAGTSTNMNANEVIANRALELLGHARGRYDIVHPNDHVNRNQSTNDAYASAVRLAMHQVCTKLESAIATLVEAFHEKADLYRDVPKLGRTQLQDAVPMSAGDELRAFANTLAEDIERIRELKRLFLEVNLGGTAIGTGAGADADYQHQIVAALAQVSGLPVTSAIDRIEATWDMGAFLLFSGMLKRLAVKLSKICNDLRLLSSGPVGGLGELRLPAQQPGSSLMPGKVNPVIPEAVNQVCFRVIGGDTAVTFAAEAGQLQLNAMEPLIVATLHESCSLLIAAMDTLTVNCIKGLKVETERCQQTLEASTALAVEMVAITGYEKAAKIAEAALQQGIPFTEYVKRHHEDLFAALHAKFEFAALRNSAEKLVGG